MKLLDLYCGQGGATVGYQRAGWDVTGVDKNPAHRRRYPARFIAADAIAYLYAHGHDYDLIHASPPCQAYSITKYSHHVEHPDLLAPTRRALIAIGKPYIIENVVGAPMIDPITLCGSMFNLATTEPTGPATGDRTLVLHLRRHRLFESDLDLHPPRACIHRNVQWAGAYGGGSVDRSHARHVRRGGYTPPTPIRGALLGIDWMTQQGLSQAIPPAYTAWLGHLAAEQIGDNNAV